jgi:hypothetical protein
MLSQAGAATLQVPTKKVQASYSPWLVLGWFALSMVPMVLQLANLFKQNPLNPLYSDIIPTIQFAVQRFLDGEMIYREVSYSSHNLPNVGYLPLQWLPFVPAKLLGIDPRWVPFSIWLGASGWIIFRTSQQNLKKGLAVMLGAWLLFFGCFYFHLGIFSMTVEFMIAGYYIFLIWSLQQNNPWLKGLGILFCLLSRYSLVLWLPLWFFIELFALNRKWALQTFSFVALGVLLVYVLPFLSQDWWSFYKTYKYYDKAAMGEWQHHNDKGLPVHLYAGNGFAYLYYEYLGHWDLAARIKALQRTHLLGSLAIVVALGLWFYRQRGRITQPWAFFLGSFKIYLCFFLGLIQVPYTYLMIVPIFVSWAIWASFWSRAEEQVD